MRAHLSGDSGTSMPGGTSLLGPAAEGLLLALDRLADGTGHDGEDEA